MLKLREIEEKREKDKKNNGESRLCTSERKKTIPRC